MSNTDSLKKNNVFKFSSITDVETLCKILELPESLIETTWKVSRELPLQIPCSLLNRIQKGNPGDPVLLQFLPHPRELEKTAGFSSDPLKEWDSEGTRPERTPGVLQKYQHRVLVLTTEACAAQCRFCFRRHFPKGHALFHGSSISSFPGDQTGKTEKHGFLPETEFDRFFEPVRKDSSIQEIIFSGGDPLILSDRCLENLFHYTKNLPHVNRVRIHTRLPVLCPERITGSFPLIQTDRTEENETEKRESVNLPAGHQTYYMVFHVNHPNEIDDAVCAMFRRLSRHGIVLLSQTVLLRGVNDDVTTLMKLFEKLIDTGVLPYYLHQLDKVRGAAHFEVSTEKGCQLVEELRHLLPGYAVPRYVREIPGYPMKKQLFCPDD